MSFDESCRLINAKFDQLYPQYFVLAIVVVRYVLRGWLGGEARKINVAHGSPIGSEAPPNLVVGGVKHPSPACLKLGDRDHVRRFSLSLPLVGMYSTS